MMKPCLRLITVLALFTCARTGHGLGTEQIGPDSAQPHPTTEQPGWPAGMIELLRRDSRIYSSWVNGNENFYFLASSKNVQELVRLFSEMRMRDHRLLIKSGKPKVKTFRGAEFDYNVHFHFLGGIAQFVARRGEEPQTYEPTLTIYVDESADTSWVEKLKLPDNIALSNELAHSSLRGKATRPKRKVWHAEVQFEGGTPATDFENGVSTKVTLWDKGGEAGILLGGVSHEGLFHAPFSDREIKDLKSGKSWLTLTVGNWLTKAKSDDPRLATEKLALDKTKVQPVKLENPGFYHGRILFEDGSPPALDPVPWPGAEIKVDFSYAGSASIDSEGYFKVYFTKDQYESLLAKKGRKNIYIPSYEKKGNSTARFAFPVSKLSTNKQQAGVVKIARPVPKAAEPE